MGGMGMETGSRLNVFPVGKGKLCTGEGRGKGDGREDWISAQSVRSHF